MHERLLPPSPNWYCSRCCDVNAKGLLGFGGKNSVYLLSVTAASPVVSGELKGHTERVSGFAFCHYPGQDDICASCSDDGTVKIWDSYKQIKLKEHKNHQSTITALHWSPLVKDLVVSGDEKGIVICYWYNRNDTQCFFPEPRNIFCLSCSPHNENHIAIGYKDGMVVIIDISRKSEVIHRLRGHDDEIHSLAWCHQPLEEFYVRHDEVLESEVASGGNGVDLAGKECYLASGSKDQTVRVWSTTRGKGVMTLKLPFLKRRGASVDPSVKERLWLTVHWCKGRSTQIVSSCFGGELILWDLTKSGKQKWTLFGSSVDGQNHTRIAFNLCSILAEDRELVFSTSMDRDVKCWDLSTLDCCWTLPSLGGFVYCLNFSPLDTGSLAVGVGDNMIRTWNTLTIQNRYDTKIFWQGIKSKVTALAWHPLKENWLAFGTDDGKVGIFDTYSNKPPQISASYHRKTIYTLAWGPPVPPLSFGGEREKQSLTLYSCAGEGTIFQHNAWKLTEEATDIDKVIRETNGIKHKLQAHSDLNWKPDGKILAVGNEDGSIEIFQALDLKLLCSIQQHHKIINALCWHHGHASQEDASYLLASGSNNAIIYVHNLKNLIVSPPDTPITMMESYRTLTGHTAKITGLAWSPHHDGRLVSVCYDGTAQLWDVMKDEPLCNYRGHKGRLLCVQWSPVDPDVIWTGGDDFTVQEWCVSKQEHLKPPKGKKGIELEKKRASQAKPKARKKKKTSVKECDKKEGSDVVNGVDESCSTRTEDIASGADEDEEEVEKKDPHLTVDSCPTQTKVLPNDTGYHRDVQVTAASEKNKPAVKSWSGKCDSVKEEKKREKQAEMQIPVKKKKARSILPLSTCMDHKSKEEQLQDCLTLATVQHSGELSSQCIPGSGAHIHLGLFEKRDALYKMFDEEGRSHIEGGHFDSLFYLLLWKGDLAGALQIATEKGELTDHLVAISSMAGYQVWARTVEAFVKQLCFQEQFVKAASYLLSVHKVYEAIDLLKSQQLYREAIALAKSRLPSEDPTLKDLYISWALVLERDGHYAAAAKCYLASDSTYEAVKVIAKKSDAMSLRTAAEIARVVGESDLSHTLSLRIAKEMLLAEDWLGAQDVLRAQGKLLGHQLIFATNELFYISLETAKLVKRSSTSAHSWTVGQDPFIETVIKLWEAEFNVSSKDCEKMHLLYQQLKSVENPPASVNVPFKQLLFHLSHDITVIIVSFLRSAWSETISDILGVVSRCSEAGNYCLMREVCKLLLPKGIDSILSIKDMLDSPDVDTLAASHSLEAFVAYIQLYEMWWKGSGTELQLENEVQRGSIDAGEMELMNDESGDHVKENSTNVNGASDECSPKKELCHSKQESSLSFCRSLLSETHAALQTTQHLIKEIQEKLSSMVHFHMRAAESKKNGELCSENPETDLTGPAQAPVAQSIEEPESLPSLIALLSEYNKTLTHIPDHIKHNPFPDVLECCLILLYMERSVPASVPEDLAKQARSLIQKYGTTVTYKKAYHSFFN
ncbi:gem-associated protein 5 isoform X1 [Polypterus senegalus]